MKCIFTIIPAADSRKTSDHRENSINEVSWLLCISVLDDDHDGEYQILYTRSFKFYTLIRKLDPIHPLVHSNASFKVLFPPPSTTNQNRNLHTSEPMTGFQGRRDNIYKICKFDVDNEASNFKNKDSDLPLQLRRNKYGVS
ncbi:hypothetical protein KIW84_025257 [Lathyrus oleraceus]|uniref:Uncharacterized protein n=1 Tax=Pisum sativum TaxID=3888 RepID=A0A9D4YIQ5_PEA|nr:hypothetical protein KIW84_025257 [Pisum sativum]